jgi:hypothetical protein
MDDSKRRETKEAWIADFTDGTGKRLVSVGFLLLLKRPDVTPGLRLFGKGGT